MTDPRMTTTDAPVTVEQAIDAEVARIMAMSDDEIMREADADDAAWARGFKLGLAAGKSAALASAPAGGGVSLSAQLASIKNAARYVPIGDGAYDPYGSAAEAVDAAVDRLAAALARPRAAVGEQSREAIARVIEIAVVERTMHHPVKRYHNDLSKWLWPLVADAILALQSPPAKVE